MIRGGLILPLVMNWRPTSRTLSTVMLLYTNLRDRLLRGRKLSLALSSRLNDAFSIHKTLWLRRRPRVQTWGRRRLVSIPPTTTHVRPLQLTRRTRWRTRYMSRQLHTLFFSFACLHLFLHAKHLFVIYLIHTTEVLPITRPSEPQGTERRRILRWRSTRRWWYFNRGSWGACSIARTLGVDSA